MEQDLSKSVLCFENAITPIRRNLRKGLRKPDLELSISILPQNLRNSLEDETVFFENSTYNNSTTFLEESKSLTGSVIRAQEPWKQYTNGLFMEFFEILQSYSESNELLAVAAEMSRCCSDTLEVINNMKSKVTAKRPDEDTWLENEWNTWKLLYALYKNRLNLMSSEDDDGLIYCGPSEKYCMLSLFRRDCLVRESQLVIDWLESNAAQKDDETLHFSDSMIGWENTLHQLSSKETIVFEATRPIVENLHPDAQHMEKKPLHDLDAEDDNRLCKKVFQEIRCGKLEQAQKLCGQSGHYWRSAQLEGWKLYHNPNLDDKFTEEFEKSGETYDKDKEDLYKEIEGNENRAIWKAMAWKIAEMPRINRFEKAAIASYSGNLEPLLHVCESWEDHLWAYLKVMVDVRVEAEIRENVTFKYVKLPSEYWDQKMSINEIFGCLEASRNPVLQKQALSAHRQIQKYIILDDINKLVECISDWISEPDISPHFLRFLTHLLMFLEQIGQVHNKEVFEQCLEEYIKLLIHMQQTQLVAFYVAKLSENMQLHIYSNYLESMVENNARKQALIFADECGLNILAITRQIVENIRRKHDSIYDGDLQHKISELDDFKISSLDWLLFYESQLPEMLRQTNTLIGLFLTLRKVDAAQLAFNKLPADIVQKVTADEDTLKDYNSFKTFLDAQEAFNVWFKHVKSKPLPPTCPSDNAHLSEKVAYEHRVSQYKAECGRWKLMIGQLSKLAKSTLYNVLLFPGGGWLHGSSDAQFLRSMYIPECILLLYNVLYDSEQLEECIQLADILASEKYKLYQVYSPEKLDDITRKLSEVSVALLNRNRDPWGHELSA